MNLQKEYKKASRVKNLFQGYTAKKKHKIVLAKMLQVMVASKR